LGEFETSFEIPSGDPKLRDGRNVLSVFVESTDPTALLASDARFYLVRHRVFYRNDQDRDGLADALEPTGGVNNSDTDGDGLLDRVENDLTKTSPSGAITITGVEPNPIIPGHAVAILGSGIENIDQPSEVLFNGLPSAMIFHTSPSAVVAKVPANLSGSSATITLVATSGGGSASAAVTMESMPPMDVVPNLVMAASANIQFLKPEFPTAQVNRPFLLNMLQFGGDTRVLIDYSASDPEKVLASFHPYLEQLFQIDGGVTDITTNFVEPLSSALLQDFDLVFVVVVDTSNVGSTNCTSPILLYTAEELAALAAWMEVPGHRLVVASDPFCSNDNHFVTNAILQAVGASSRFYETLGWQGFGDFPFGHEQENIPYHTLTPLSDPPLTDGVLALFYAASGDIILGLGATLTAEARICLANEIGNTVPGPFGDDLLVDCQSGEQTFPPFVTNYVASETLPVANPDPVVEITTVNASLVNPVAVPAGPGTLVELDPLTNLLSPPATIQVDGTFQNISPTQVTVNGTPATIVGNTFSAQLSGFLSAQHEARGIFVEAVNDQGPQTIKASDTLVIRVKRERPRMKFVIFQSDQGVPAIQPADLDKSRRQAGLELFHLCRAPNATPLDTRPGIEPSLWLVDPDAIVANQSGYDLRILTVEFDPEVGFREVLSPEARGLLQGNLPDSGNDPSGLIPDPGPFGAAAPLDFRVFVSGRFKQHIVTPMGISQEPVDAPLNPESDRSVGGLSVFNVEGTQATIVQARLSDTEGGADRVDRPVISKLGHEFAHVLAGVSDNENEPPAGFPVDLPPGPGGASLMNSSPFFRSLALGTASSPICEDEYIPVSSIDEICQRVVDGYSCPGSGTLDFTE
jgi:hypothetical protein